jgi:hypothetical protein
MQVNRKTSIYKNTNVWIQPAKIPGRKAGQSSNAKIERWERELKKNKNNGLDSCKTQFEIKSVHRIRELT